MRIRIKRQRSPFSEPYWEEFAYDARPLDSVAAVLDGLNYADDIVNAQGEPVPRINWETSCQQGMCGSCAMVICGKPALACETFVRDLPAGDITIEPLRKFFVISDLLVDRAIIHDGLRDAGVFIRAYRDSAPGEFDHQYLAAKCLKCGLCLEVCPNYAHGERFFGALFANDCYLVESKSEAEGSLSQVYGEHFASGCSKSLSCVDVCPMHIPTLASMAKMNRGKMIGR